MASPEWDIINNYPAEALSLPSYYMTHNMPEIYWASIKDRFYDRESYYHNPTTLQRITWFYSNYFMLKSPDLMNVITDTPNFITGEFNLEYYENYERFSRNVIEEENIHNLLRRMNPESPVFVTIAERLFPSDYTGIEPDGTIDFDIILNAHAIALDQVLFTTVASLVDSCINVFAPHIKELPGGFVIHNRSRWDSALHDYISDSAQEHDLEYNHLVFTCLMPHLFEHLYVFNQSSSKVILNPNRTLIRRQLVIG
jgi:hypothetical protein